MLINKRSFFRKNEGKFSFSLIIAFLFFTSLPFKAQDSAIIKKIDSLSEDIQHVYNIDSKKAMEQAKLVLSLSEKNSYDTGKVNGLQSMMAIYRMNGEMTEALRYCTLLEDFSLKVKNYKGLCDGLRSRAIIYENLGLYTEAEESLNKALTYSPNLTPKFLYHKLRGLIFEAFYILYRKLENNSKALKNIILCQQEYDKMNAIDDSRQDLIIGANNNIALIYMEMGKYDDAYIYIQRNLNNKALSDFPYSQTTTFFYFGRFNRFQKKYKEAIPYLDQALVLNKNSTNDPYMRRDIYDELYYCYKGLGDMKKYTDYLEKYQFVADSLVTEEKKAVSVPVKNIVDKKNNELTKTQHSLKWMVLLIVLGVILVGVATFFIYRYYKKEKENISTMQTRLLSKRERISEMEQKVNNAFDEVLSLAKSDDPAFLSRFKEVYPEFYNKLVSAYPDLTVSQIRFCALLRLNFSTKEIAHYHHMTISGIHSKKNRLRKQLNIDSDIDLNKWMIDF